MVNVFHISNTDICLDSRIQKELKALSDLAAVSVFVVGVPDSKTYGNTELCPARYYRLRLFTRTLNVFPRAIRYFFELIEFTVKAAKIGGRLKPGIVHCHDTFALPAGWILKKMLGCHLIYDAHELESNKNGQNAILSYATLMIEKFCWKQVDLLVSVSDSITDWYMCNLGAKSSVLVLNSPVIADETRVNFDTQGRRNYFHEKYSIPAEHLIFVYLGILGVGRGIEITLEAFASKSINAHVVFVGYGDLVENIQSYCHKYPNIHLHAPVPHDQVVPFVKSADVGLCLIENVSLSDYYCLPNKLFEYCFAGIHILGSDFPEMRKIIDQYSLGTCCALDPAKVREAIHFLIDHRPSRTNTDVSPLSWEAQAERLVSCYRKLLDSEANIKTNQGKCLKN